MTPAERQLLASALAEFATDLDHRGYPYAGGLRQAAQLVATLDAGDQRRCSHCRRPLDADAHARRRYCGDRCRHRAHRQRKRDGAAQ